MCLAQQVQGGPTGPATALAIKKKKRFITNTTNNLNTMDTNKGLCPRNCRLVSALICPEMQGNKKPIFFLRKSSQSDRLLEKRPHKTLFEIRSSEIQKS